MPITIVSRCQKFEFHKIKDEDVINTLKNVCEKENINYELDGLNEIAVLSDGGLRDALSMLDQLSKNNEKITYNKTKHQKKRTKKIKTNNKKHKC